MVSLDIVMVLFDIILVWFCLDISADFLVACQLHTECFLLTLMVETSLCVELRF